MDVVCDGRRLEATTGDFVFVPRGQPHGYLVRSDQARLLAIYTAPGWTGSSSTTAPPSSATRTTPAIDPDPEALAASAARYAFEILGPPLTLE